jgi:hypothetical protein
MKKTITLVTGKQRPIVALTCGQVENVQLALVEVQKETNPILAQVALRRIGASICADAMSGAGQPVTVDDVMADLTEAELDDMITQVRAYNGLTATTEGEAAAAGSNLPISTVA